ncbi:hypothetical protein CYLTODRAFT_455200 [Cylindrobasidium torrendii FP15055 ss-10]|uniref:Sterol regulatory element-binding protein cleavage-activating protein n=1 Tax=Cylindrobasidium torrendii FP15055 ss-10 TaxID=1314674 RepID=A0A0D7B817_9AGAR|nr:hypothetical protein CYLTODRAFT_455200 [Cylindrobasidium torrendii FP15055 ss-10]
MHHNADRRPATTTAPWNDSILPGFSATMLDFPGSVMDTVRSYGNRCFLRFGLHCATHQIRVILISGVVITSLFYPALALYSTTQPHSVSILGSSSTGFNAQQDLMDVWDGYNNLHVREDAVSRARCGVGRTVRVERVLIESTSSALNQQTLLSTLKLEETVHDAVVARCVRRLDGRCLVLSPLEFWNHDRERLLADGNILHTLSSSNITVAGIPLAPDMVLAGRESDTDDAPFDFATFLALTYFFPETDCLGKSDHINWLQTLQNAKAPNVELHVEPEEPFLLALEHGPRAQSWSAISVFLYSAYASFAIYVTWSMRQMNTVHSRVGVTFTALVEIAVSTVTSLSVCALVGFKVTMVPWELLPILIVFVGAENMFNLVDAVGKTRVTLPVKQRIAEGLSLAGTSNTLKVFFYNAVLGAIAGVSGGAVRQFCAFAVVVLCAHWFLAHTFFLAVLSIDMQRLELEELLRLDPSLTPAIPLKATENRKPKSSWAQKVIVFRSLFGGRARKNLSLFLLLATTATLYYATLPADTMVAVTSPVHRNALSRQSTSPGVMDPAWDIWTTLNPTESILHLRVESPTVLTFRPELEEIDAHKSNRPRLRAFKFLTFLLRVVVGPIVITTTALYGLLLYLLKDTELLEAQKHRAHIEDPPSQPELPSLLNQVTFTTLPRAFSSDVELIATSKDLQVAITVGLQNEIVIWRLGDRSHVSIDASDVLLRSPSSSASASTVTCVAMAENGDYCAVGTGAGVIAVWGLRHDRVQAFPAMSLGSSSTTVVELQFMPTKITRTPPQSRPTSPTDHGPPVTLLAVYENDTVVRWSVSTQLSTPQLLRPPTKEPGRPKLLRVSHPSTVLAAFCDNNGRLDLLDLAPRSVETVVMSDFSVQAGTAVDRVVAVHVCRSVMGEVMRTVVAAATESGLITLWDGLTGDLIRMLDETYGRVKQLTVAPVPATACKICTRLRPETLLLTFGVHEVVHTLRVQYVDTDRRCACPPVQPARHGRTATNSPMARHARLSSGGLSSSFPVSAHGVHSRRVSEKDSLARKASMTEIFHPMADDSMEGDTLGPGGIVAARPVSTFWVGVQVTRLLEVDCERGVWGVYEGKVVGVRRRPRLGKASGLTGGSEGLPVSTLERWEVWTFDSAECEVQDSPLSMLARPEAEEHVSPAPSSVPRLPFTRVAPMVISRHRGLAGFGNTLGVLGLVSA